MANVEQKRAWLEKRREAIDGAAASEFSTALDSMSLRQKMEFGDRITALLDEQIRGLNLSSQEARDIRFLSKLKYAADSTKQTSARTALLTDEIAATGSERVNWAVEAMKIVKIDERERIAQTAVDLLKTDPDFADLKKRGETAAMLRTDFKFESVEKSLIAIEMDSAVAEGRTAPKERHDAILTSLRHTAKSDSSYQARAAAQEAFIAVRHRNFYRMGHALGEAMQDLTSPSR